MEPRQDLKVFDLCFSVCVCSFLHVLCVLQLLRLSLVEEEVG